MLVGITGGIGSGKSTIVQVLAARGYAVYDCDREAKRIILENAAVRKAIIALLGTEAFVPSPQHPFTGIRVQSSEVRVQNSEFSVLFVESAILFEAGIDSLCDRIVVVDAPEEVRLQRTIARDYHGDATEEHINKVRARMRAQLFRPTEEQKATKKEQIDQHAFSCDQPALFCIFYSLSCISFIASFIFFSSSLNIHMVDAHTNP